MFLRKYLDKIIFYCYCSERLKLILKYKCFSFLVLCENIDFIFKIYIRFLVEFDRYLNKYMIKE